MTMQTTEPLPELRMESWNTTLMQIKGWHDREGGLDLDPPYQRGDVWGLVRRRNLIRSFLQNIPIPSLILNDRFKAKFHQDGYSQDRRWTYAVIDGKQRITTILMFYRNDLAIPASWLDTDLIEQATDTDDGPYVTYSGLTDKGRRHFDMCPIDVRMGRCTTLAEEEFVFALVNYGGVAQGETDADLGSGGLDAVAATPELSGVLAVLQEMASHRRSHR